MQKNCKVELWDINESALVTASQELGKEFDFKSVSYQVIDISREKSVATAVENFKNANSRIDILINNAALNPKFSEASSQNTSRLENYPIDIWNHEIAVGLTGSLLCAKHIGAYMALAKKGVILNISSDLSVIAPDQRIYHREGVSEMDQFKKPVSYSVIKAGLVGLTRYLASYWAESGIRVNALSPGGVYESQDEVFVKRLIELIPLRRMATKEEYIGAIQFLCSDASDYMTGQNIIMDGGRSIW
jgi:NAD(P)-dependent dehydrogenase (short-subunit alcohol dehydrogenase family)